MRVLVLVSSLLLAGCASPAPLDPATGGEFGAPMAELSAAVADLPCEAEMSEGTTGNLRVLAHLPLDDPEPTSHRELDLHPTLPVLASARIGAGGMDLVDLSDPQRPRVLSTWHADDEDGFAADVKFLPDGATLVMAGGSVIRLVDVRDLAAPRLESVFKLAAPGAHMVTTFEVEGASYVAAAKGEGADLSVFRVDGEPGSRTLERVATPGLTPLSAIPDRNDFLRTHDAWFEVDPVTQTPTLWIANVWFGVLALDVSDPADPKPIASIPHEDVYQSYVHTVRVARVDGKRLVVATSEYGNAALKVWDATDLAAPKHLASWSIGGNAPHDFQVVGPRAYVTHFEQGFFVFDLAALLEGGALAPVAHLEPNGEPNLFETVQVPTNLFGAYFGPVDVVVHDGVLWVQDESTGLRSVAYGCLAPGDATARSWG